MSRGLIIAIVVLSLALVALLFVPKPQPASPAPAIVSVGGDVASNTPNSVPSIRTQVTAAPTTVAPTTNTTIRRANANLISTGVTTQVVAPTVAEAPKTLPEMEKAYLSTTNRDSRLDLMMDISEVPTADSVKTLTRLFEAEADPDMKVDLIDSLLGIDGFKDEKLIMLTLAIRQGLPNDVRESAIDGLIDLEDRRGIALLNGLLNDPDAQIRQSAQDAIELLQAPANQIPKLR
jgi:HEAT repeat protein